MSPPSDLLGRTTLFGALPAMHREQIAGHLTRHEVAAGTEVFRQGGPGDALFVIESGSVGVFVQDAKLGVVQLVSRLEAPESFGEMAMVTGEPRTATCTAMDPSVVLRLGRDVFEALVKQAPAVALGVAKTLAERLAKVTLEREIPWVSLAGRQLDRKLWALGPDPALRRARVVPLELAGRTLTVGMVEPQDQAALDVLRQTAPGMRFKIVAVSADDYQRFVGGIVGAAAAEQAAVVSLTADQRPQLSFIEDDDRAAKGAATSGQQVLQIVDEIVGTALATRASDIHVEQDRRGVAVRYRVDGQLRARPQLLPAELGRSLVSRFKLLAKLDITETRKPQDGRISVQTQKKIVDLRLSTMPSKLGEKVVLRVLDAEQGVSDLKALFAIDKVRQLFAEMVFRPHGLVLVTGPTGSGKTTTLYAALQSRARPELNVVTVEDPIEYHLDGITQVQVKAEIGTTFGVVLRSLLRQDPDVILVGETRDSETARMAVEASMTGHLVLTSMHTNGALESILRLADLGVEPYAVGNSLLGVLHQRLVRRICTQCAETFEYPEPIVERLVRVGAFRAGETPALQRGKGCQRCGNTGFRGRVGVFELLVVNDAVRAAISAGADMAKLRESAQGAMVDLARYAGVLVATGTTVPGEVLHMLQKVGS